MTDMMKQTKHQPGRGAVAQFLRLAPATVLLSDCVSTPLSLWASTLRLVKGFLLLPCLSAVMTLRAVATARLAKGFELQLTLVLHTRLAQKLH